jgi:hypothetical protein
MGTQRMAGIPGFGIDRVAAAVGSDREVLRLENLDTDLLPPQEALRATREAVGVGCQNSPRHAAHSYSWISPPRISRRRS